MHIALGVRTNAFPIDAFLNAPGRREVAIEASTRSGNRGRRTLTISSNPLRRGGEWLIRDQFGNRHPAWSPAAGFPSTYNAARPPYILIFRAGENFHARFLDSANIGKLEKKTIPAELLSQTKGIIPAPLALLSAFDVPSQTSLEAFDEAAANYQSDAFDPANISDGRRRIIAAVLLRQGQGAFRRRLLTAYDNMCAVTRCATTWVLEAAHISPYRGVKTNDVSNGLLLRADIHTLFDLGLISIEPNDLKVRVASLLRRSSYAAFDRTKLVIPARDAHRPSRAALAEHYASFQQ